MSGIDVERVLCPVADIPDGGSKGFAVGDGDWPLKGLLVRSGESVNGYVNYCPHAGHPLNFLPDRFLTPDGRAILCLSHGAVFEKETGYCVMGPCAGESLTRVPLKVQGGYVMLDDGVDVATLAPKYW